MSESEPFRSVTDQLVSCVERIGEFESEGHEARYVLVVVGLIKRGPEETSYTVRQYANCDYWTARGLMEDAKG